MQQNYLPLQTDVNVFNLNEPLACYLASTSFEVGRLHFRRGWPLSNTKYSAKVNRLSD